MLLRQNNWKKSPTHSYLEVALDCNRKNFFDCSNYCNSSPSVIRRLIKVHKNKKVYCLLVPSKQLSFLQYVVASKPSKHYKDNKAIITLYWRVKERLRMAKNTTLTNWGCCYFDPNIRNAFFFNLFHHRWY